MVVWPHALEQNVMSVHVHDREALVDRKQRARKRLETRGKLQRYANVSLLSTKSHILKFLPPPKIVSLGMEPSFNIPAFRGHFIFKL